MITTKVYILFNFNVENDNHDREAISKEIGLKNQRA